MAGSPRKHERRRVKNIALRQSDRLSPVIGRYTALQDRAGELVGRCPACGEHRLTVNAERTSWRCYGCNVEDEVGGDLAGFEKLVGKRG